jgi:pimeloyl-ACP methyl ester carboxylesterase
MPYARANGIDIYYEIVGEGLPGTPIVMTHGFAGPFRQWRPEIERLGESRPLILYDVRGHDRSSVPADVSEYSMPLFAADLAALLRGIGVGMAHVGGVSMGGMVTAQFAVDYPEMCASVMVCDSTCGNASLNPAVPGPAEGAGTWEQALFSGISALSHMVQKYGLKETVLREYEWKKANDKHLGVSPYSLEEDLDRIKLMTSEGYVGAAHAIATRPDLTSRITAITAPTLVMIGEWDDFLPCALRDHELIPDSRLVVRERCGHGSRWRAETFIAEIERFVADVETGRPVAERVQV